MKKRLLMLVLALAAVAGASPSNSAVLIPPGDRCGWVCSAPGCCNYCCFDQPCAYPICDLEP